MKRFRSHRSIARSANVEYLFGSIMEYIANVEPSSGSIELAKDSQNLKIQIHETINYDKKEQDNPFVLECEVAYSATMRVEEPVLPCLKTILKSELIAEPPLKKRKVTDNKTVDIRIPISFDFS